MITVFVVDDEPMLRMALKNVFPWNILGCEIVGEASNGKIAKERICKNPPDILITDIKMPEMNGIELLQFLKEQHINTKVIILSGYNDFEYVRDGLLAGAVDYILKPHITEEKLKSVLKKVIEQIHQEKKSNVHDKRKRTEDDATTIRKWLSHEEHNIDPISQIELLKHPYYVVRMEFLNNRILDKWEKSDSNMLSGVINDVLSQYCEKEICYWQASMREWVFLLNEEKIHEIQWEDVIAGIKMYTNINGIIGISELCKELKDMEIAFHQCREAIQYYFYNKKTVQNYRSNRFNEENLTNLQLQVTKEIPKLIQEGKWKSLAEYQHPILMFAKKKWIYPDKLRNEILEYILFCQSQLTIRMNVTEKWFHSYEIQQHLKKINDFEELENYTKQMISNLVHFLAEWLKTDYSPIISNALEYIADHYMEDVSVNEIADRVNLNAAYFSHLFKKETGVTAKEYITKMRIERTKELLKNSEYSIETIAGMVGYMNSKYLFRIFKKETGISPLKYRQKNEY